MIDRRLFLSASGAAAAGGALAPIQMSSEAAAAGVAEAQAVGDFPTQIAAVDVLQHCHVATSEDVSAARAAVIDRIWNGAGMPDFTWPAGSLTPHAPPPAYTGFHRLGLYQRATIHLPMGQVSWLELFNPKLPLSTPIGGVIVHGGHAENAGLERAEFIKSLLVMGLFVVVLNMPLYGLNGASQVLDSPRGKIRINASQLHAHYAAVHTEDFHPLQFFLTPVKAAVDLLVAASCEKIAMTGYSGGGWTTQTYPALDPRIDASYPVEGGFPMYCRSWDGSPGSLGDWESWIPGIPPSADFLDLYVMAADRPGRRQVQFFSDVNSYFQSGHGALPVTEHYRPEVQARAAALGGDWNILWDLAPSGPGGWTPWMQQSIRNELTIHLITPP